MAPSPKELKEAFVSNLTGGTITEINLVTIVAPTAVLVWSALQSRYGIFSEDNISAYVADFILNAGAILLSITLYSAQPATLVGLLLFSSIMYRYSPTTVMNSKSAKQSKKTKENTSGRGQDPFPIRPFLTAYRGSMMVITCAAILAVDFPVFPRRFAKVETWGTSLMDVGVGSFVFSAGLIASKAALKDAILAGKKDTNYLRQGIIDRVVTGFRHSLPLLVLGAARLLSVKNLDYAEHVSEYGVHWNFFFTLALTPLALAIIQPVIGAIPGPSYAIVGLLLSAGYEVVLSSTDLKKWALTAPRVDLLSQNKEGITSSVGYIAIFLLGMSTGTIVLPRNYETAGPVPKLLDKLAIVPAPGSSHSDIADIGRYRLLARLALSSIFYWALLGVHMAPAWFPQLSVGVSRRLANFPYVLWIAAYNTMQITLYCLVETIFFPSVRRASTKEAANQEAAKATSKVLDDFNAAGLPVFLVANIGTGLVNMTVNTLETGSYRAMYVLVGYMGVLAVAARYLRAVKLRI